MPKKVYYRATGVTTFDWVESLDEATKTDKEAAEVTQKQFHDSKLVEIPGQRSSTWVLTRDVKSTEEKLEIIRKAETDLRKKATEVGLAGPFISWVMDMNGVPLILDAPRVSDTSALPPISWDSNRFFVTIFSESRKVPISTVVDF